MGHVTVWFNNDFAGSQPVIVKWRTGNNLSSLILGKGKIETRTFTTNDAKNFSIHRRSDDTMARKWEALSDDTVINIGSLNFTK